MNPGTSRNGAEHRTALPVMHEDDGRRVFLARLSFGLAGFSALLAGVPVVGAIVGPLLKRVPSPWRVVGKLEEFALGETVKVEFEDASSVPWSGVTARSAAWLRRESQTEFVAFSINCRHLGCPVRWVPDAELFMCPCHGGVYYKDGTVAAGPPPEPLHRYPVRVQDGNVEIRAEPIPLTT